MNQFPSWLKERRKALDLTQAELAQQVGCSMMTIYKIESGARRPSRQIAERIAACLEIPADQRERFVKLARAIAQPQPEAAAPPAAPPPPAAAPPPAPAASRPAPPIPAPPTRLIGRERELARIDGYLAGQSRRLITVLGPGGVGKTRLSLEIARRAAGHFRDGVAWVPLADISDPALVAPAIAQCLAIPERAGLPVQELLAQTLAGQQLLLVLDNLEQVIAAAPLVSALIAACPGLSVLATSRVPLRVRGEQEFPLKPFLLAGAQQADPAALAEHPAVALFVDRAQLLDPDFSLTAENGAAILAICRRLDGLPLAIELVAAQIKFTQPDAIAAELQANALPLLVHGPVDAEPRHQTLRQAFDWSFALLPPPIRELFMTLGVFNGPWPAAAAAALNPSVAEDAALLGLRHLAETNLIQLSWDAGARQPDYALLETARDYALQRLAEAGREPELRRRHAAYYCDLAEAAAPRLTGADQQAALARIEYDRPNLRAAIQWALAAAPDTAERLVAALSRFWWLRSHFTEAQNWIEQTLALPVSAPKRRAVILNAAGSINLELGRRAQAQAFHRQALALWEELGDREGIARSLGNLGNIARQQGDAADAMALFGASLAQFQALDHPWGVATTLLNLGTIVEDQSDLAAAEAYYRQSLAAYRALGDQHGVALALANLGGVALVREQADQALELYREVLKIRQALMLRNGMVPIIEAAARAFVLQGRGPLAARLWGAAAALRLSLNMPISPSYQRHHQETMAMLRANLDPAALEAYGAEGAAMELDAVVASIAQAP